MYNDLILFLSGFGVGVTSTLCIIWLVAHVYSRISGQPAPSGATHQVPYLPFSVKDEAHEARIERLALDNPEGLGR